MKKKLPDNIILVDKPKGITSFDVIRRLRKELGIRKMGHAGTLDPLASGLMIIGVNEGTKRMEEFLKLPKSYEAEILLGTQTDSGDLEGEVIESVVIHEIEEDYIREAINNFVGVYELPVPKYSAIKRGGKPLYEYARKGIDIEVPVKSMEILESKFISVSEMVEGYVIKATFDVASGTYIRSLVEYLGRFFEVPATLANLRRTRIGEFDLKQARKLK